MQNDPRSRILLLLQLLLKQTDEHHYATGADILRFWETHGIQTTRKNVYSDIQLLMDFGLDIICIKSTQNRYFIGSRLLELPELKLLVDAVESSHLITEKKSAVLIEKLGHLTSRHNAAILNRPVYMDGTAKPDNEAVYYTIDTIQTAIHKQRAISFQYFEYTPEKEKVLKHKGYRYGFSPYALIWNQDFYYAVGWSEKHGKLAQFRVVYGFHSGGEGCHFPEYLLQPCYPVCIQGDYIHTVIGPCGFHRKHCHDLPPVRRGTVYDNPVVVPGLQFLQLTSVFHIDLGDGRTERHRGTVSRLVGEQDTKGGGD